MNNYTQVKIKLSAVGISPAADSLSWDDAADVLNNSLAGIGFESFEVDKPYIVAYSPSRLYDYYTLVDCLETFPFRDSFLLEIKEVVEIEGQDWNSEWEKNYFQPYVFGDNKCVVHSSFHKDYPQCEYDILIDPKMAFGTGHHATTQLMVEALFNTAVEGKTVLDVGTGSAILAILASQLKAKKVYAVEIDEAAYTNATENIRLNSCTDIQTIHGEVYHLQDGLRFDIVLANINRNIILDDMPEYFRHLKTDGIMYLSGFYKQDVDIIDERARQCKLELCYRKENNDWTVLGYKKQNGVY